MSLTDCSSYMQREETENTCHSLTSVVTCREKGQKTLVMSLTAVVTCRERGQKTHVTHSLTAEFTCRGRGTKTLVTH